MRCFRTGGLLSIVFLSLVGIAHGQWGGFGPNAYGPPVGTPTYQHQLSQISSQSPSYPRTQATPPAYVNRNQDVPANRLPSVNPMPSTPTPDNTVGSMGSVMGSTPGGNGWGSYGQMSGKGKGVTCDDCCEPCCVCGCWYGGIGGAYMTRDNGNRVWTSFDTAATASQLLGTSYADPEYGWGPNATIGHSLRGGCYGIEATYWGIYPGRTSATAVDPDGTPLTASDLSTTFAFDTLEYNGPNAVVDFYDNAFVHQLNRSYEVHNVEVNFVGSPCGGLNLCMPCDGRRVRWRWLVGARYMKFNDGFEFWTDNGDTVFTGDVNEVQYNIDVDNHLIGGQLGGGVDYYIFPRFGLYANAKVGAYLSRMEHTSVIQGSGGTAVINSPGTPYDGQPFNVSTTKDDIAMMGEIDLGARFRITPRFSGFFGYRAVAVSGVALAPNQIPQFFGDLGGVQDIDSNGHLILHGGYGGLEFMY